MEILISMGVYACVERCDVEQSIGFSTEKGRGLPAKGVDTAEEGLARVDVQIRNGQYTVH
ncbi:hypothetical protein GCM10011400_60880 [Paraburkholderia caffeinilytica]|uniref:Uncharacterized protein n=1 Tax=Paraburkholderia caffeinilytica TaxID=1761016 RepID=A0ABQ1NAF5_9BURK|nr:hypothetical protein GCM10011400_60880 [Paraburkholderia caffeinilytica]